MPLDAVYNLVKHESERTETSSVLDSPQHLKELEPFYSIRPIYLASVSTLSRVFQIQQAISLVSCLSFIGIGIVVLFWTKRPILSALLMASYPIVLLARTPDALAALLSVFALYLVQLENRGAVEIALATLCLCLGVRTDSILLFLSILAWLAWRKRLSKYYGIVLGLIAVVIVLAINKSAGNYGWVVLFRYSFIGGRYPAQVPHTLRATEYLSALLRGGSAIFSQVSWWILLGAIAWLRRPNNILCVIAFAAATHFIIYPSPEQRYLVWAYIITGIIAISSAGNSVGKVEHAPCDAADRE